MFLHLFISLIFMNLSSCQFGDQLSATRLNYDGVEYRVLLYSNETASHTESPVWDERTNTLYWVDVINQDVHALQYQSLRHWAKHISYGEVNVVTPLADSKRLFVGVRAGVYLLDPSKSGDSALRLIAALDVDRPDNVINEGKADALGRYWAGTKGSPSTAAEVTPDYATLYSMEQPNFKPRVQLQPVTISNGMTWALNNSIFYYIDSPTKNIEAFDYDLATGNLRNRRTIVDTTEYECDPKTIPDGMTIDRDGCLWVAMIFGGSIIRIDPDTRSIISRYYLPVSDITSLTWAGPSLDHLVVTSSSKRMNRAQRAKSPLASAIFILKDLGTGGVPVNKVAFQNADQY